VGDQVGAKNQKCSLQLVSRNIGFSISRLGGQECGGQMMTEALNSLSVVEGLDWPSVTNLENGPGEVVRDEAAHTWVGLTVATSNFFKDLNPDPCSKGERIGNGDIGQDCRHGRAVSFTPVGTVFVADGTGKVRAGDLQIVAVVTTSVLTNKIDLLGSNREVQRLQIEKCLIGKRKEK